MEIYDQLFSDFFVDRYPNGNYIFIERLKQMNLEECKRIAALLLRKK